MVEVVAGTRHSLARTEAGGILAWGDNRHGQLCQAALSHVPLPAEIEGLQVNLNYQES